MPAEVRNITEYRNVNGTLVKIHPETSADQVLYAPQEGQQTTVDAALAGKAEDSSVVHIANNENITGEKTFVGTKRIKFKQGTNNDKLGFTLYTNKNVEQGYLEYNPTNKINGAPLLTLGNYTSTVSGRAYVGFRKYSSISGAEGSYNLLAPLVVDARQNFELTTSSYTNFFLPLGFTDGTTVVTVDQGGMLNLSPLLPDTDAITTSEIDTLFE